MRIKNIENLQTIWASAMITNTVSRFESLNKGARAGRRPTRRDNQRETKSDFEFIILCIVLTAMIFGVIHAVVYFTDSSSAAGGISTESAMAPKRNP
jgi:hypothetical protein